MDLQDVLLAFCIHNPNVGYCQGMNFLVAMALLFMDAQDAFWYSLPAQLLSQNTLVLHIFGVFHIYHCLMLQSAVCEFSSAKSLTAGFLYALKGTCSQCL